MVGSRAWMVGAVLCTAAGCLHPTARMQISEEPDTERAFHVRTIGDVTTVANAEPVPVSGVGLVVGLAGTGGSVPPGGFRAMLESQLRKQGVENVKEILASPNHSMVLVSGVIPPGARKGDPIDLVVTLPEQSKTTSLRGGYLTSCTLYNYDSARKLSPTYPGTDRPILGHAVGSAQGPILVGFDEGDEGGVNLRQGIIWGGGKTHIDRPFFLVLDEDKDPGASLTRLTAERINETFHGASRSYVSDVAVAKVRQVVHLGVPMQYRLNLPHFLRVVRMIPLGDAAGGRGAYRRHLEEQLLDPAHTITAALRLEALGSEGIPILKGGLASSHPLVRFAAAEALAYLGEPVCGEELAHLAETQPLLRGYCLTALASLDEAVSRVKLRDLLSSPSVETRYGAFRALHALDPHDEAVAGEHLNDSFWLHVVPAAGDPLVHLSVSRRPEIVVFGRDVALVPPFSFLAGEFTITAAENDDRCIVSRLSVDRGTNRRPSSLRVDDVLRTLAELDGHYPEALEIMRQAGRFQNVSAPVAIERLPQNVVVQNLAPTGAEDDHFQKIADEILAAQDQMTGTPTLFQRRKPTGR